jgi:hypothetical protein
MYLDHVWKFLVGKDPLAFCVEARSLKLKVPHDGLTRVCLEVAVQDCPETSHHDCTDCIP